MMIEQKMFFSCTQCGACCYNFVDDNGNRSAVYLTEKDLYLLNTQLKMNPEDLASAYLDVKNDFIILKHKTIGTISCCIFLESNKKCQIYDVRPEQCRTYPYWGPQFRGDKTQEEFWRHEAKTRCPGIKFEENFSTKNSQES